MLSLLCLLEEIDKTSVVTHCHDLPTQEHRFFLKSFPPYLSYFSQDSPSPIVEAMGLKQLSVHRKVRNKKKKLPGFLYSNKKKLQEVLGDYFESEPMLCGHPLGALPLKTAEIHFLQAKQPPVNLSPPKQRNGLRPSPRLEKNFHPEDLESLQLSGLPKLRPHDVYSHRP